MNIISLSAYVLVGKTRGTACGVRRRWRRCRICVSLCRPAGRSCPLSVAGGAVCRGSLTGETAMEERASPPVGETRTRSEPTGGCTPSGPRSMVGRDDCGAAGWMSYTTRRRCLSAVRGEFEKCTLADDPHPHNPTTGSSKCGFPGTETIKPLRTPLNPQSPCPPVFPENTLQGWRPTRRITLFPWQ